MSAPPLLLTLLALLWLAIGLGAALVAIRGRDDARAAAARVRLLEAMLAAAPAVPLVATARGRIAMPPRTCAWLGLDAPVEHLDGLVDAGFPADRIAMLRAAIDGSLTAAAPIALTLAIPGSGRRLAFGGGPLLLPGGGERTIVLWISDSSDSHARIEQLTADGDRLAALLDGLSALIEAAPIPIWRRDARGALTFVNRSYVNAVEARDSADVVRRALELVEGTSPAAVDPAPGGGRLIPAIVAGERRMMRVIEAPILALGTAGFAIDAQDLEEARADLARFAETQRAMLDRLTAGVAQFAADGGLIFYNFNFRRFFGLDPETLDELSEFDRVLEGMREARRAPEVRDFRAWRAERRAWFSAAEAVIESWLLPDGTHLRVVAQPLPDGGLLVLFEDRSEHVQLTSARDTLLRVRSATFDNLFEAVGVFAADGRLHLWNHKFRQLWGLEEAVLLGRPHLDSLVQAMTPRLADPQQASVIRELVRVATIDRRHRAGRLTLGDGRSFDFAAVPLPDGNALFALLDVTASQGIEEVLRVRNELLEETNQLRGRFVARMSYELRVPLTSITGFAEMLAGGYAGPLSATARDYVGAILRAVDRLQELIGDSLDLSQSELGSIALADDPLDIAALVRDAGRAAADAALVAGIGLGLDIAPDSGFVIGDGPRLRRSLDHLVRNALAHTPPQGQVILRTRLFGDQVEIVVSDTGAGMAEADRARLTESDAPIALVTEEVDGAAPAARRGVGLPLARRLIAAHGGTLRIASAPGEGTSVVIRLPLAARDG